MNNSTYESELTDAGIRVTAIRLLIWRTIRQEISNAFSLADLQNLLPTVDKSTVFRTLTLFADNHLLHPIDDGSGMQKYCVGVEGDDSDAVPGTGHIHLTCTQCHKTWCLEDVEIPAVDITSSPAAEGFTVTAHEYVIKGVCRKCRNGWR